MDNLSPTPYADLNLVLKDLVESLRAALAGNLVGVYLQGSFAVGDFDEHSDVDFIVVTENPLATAEVDALQKMHGRIFETNILWAKHLEGSYFPKSVIQQYEDCSEKLWYLDNGSRELIQETHCNTVLVRWVVRDMGVTLTGPPPISFMDSIPVVALRRQIWAVMHDWGKDILADPEPYRNRFYQQFLVQNYSRMLHDLVKGVPGSKRGGTEWAKENLDPKWHDLIDRSWSSRGNGFVTVRQPADPDDMQATLTYVQYIMDESGKYNHLLE